MLDHGLFVKRLSFCRRYIFYFVLLVPFLVVEPVFAEHGDIVINNYSDKEGMRPVIFSHWFHRIRFRCRVCHTEIGFIMEAGANKITMAKIIKGDYCGACHNGEIAWSIENCGMCHSALPGTKTGSIGSHRTGGPGKW